MVASATDAYQPAELKYGLTRRCIQVLQKYGVPYYVFTKSAIIDRDLDLHKRYSYNCFVVWSITTANERVRRIVEPGTPSIQRTFAVIKRFADAGIPCGVNIDPILPLVTDTDEEIDLLLALCGKAGVKHIFGEVLRLRNDIWDRIKLTIKLLGINRGEEQYREIYKIVEPLSAKSYISCNSEYAKKLYGILYEKVRSAGMHFGFPDHIRPQQINRASSSTGQTTILSFTLPPSEPT
jgi:DNA repair photolyase